MKKRSLIFYTCGIIITLVIIILILFNTIFYDYKGKLNTYLDYYYSGDINTDNTLTFDNIDEAYVFFKNGLEGTLK